MAFVVAVDGPAASGKTSVSREVAKRFGWVWVSTGAFYRGLAFAAHRLGLGVSDEGRLVSLIDSHVWSVVMEPDMTRVTFQGQDVTRDIFQEEVGSLASQISRIPSVRQALLGPQRDCAKGQYGLVAEGRDCGTVVFPQAGLKVYLTADSAARAVRRAQEQGQPVEGILEAQRIRDQSDSSRQVAPMKVAEDAVILDTTELTLDQVVDQIEELIRERLQ
jgi:cytidylate kinase